MVEVTGFESPIVPFVTSGNVPQPFAISTLPRLCSLVASSDYPLFLAAIRDK
jgi:hypothetical protein